MNEQSFVSKSRRTFAVGAAVSFTAVIWANMISKFTRIP